jgi:DNA-binding MurR/RpiR family transcriptional regulator
LGIQSSIENSAGQFTPTLQRVAAAILANPSIVLDQTISELATSCQTSVASVVRFCRALGLSGYAQLRMSLATELGREAAQFGLGMTLGAEIAKSDTLQDMASKVATLEMMAIEQTVSSLDFEALERVVAAIDRAQRILLFGVGASHFVAQDLHHKLFRIGRNAFVMADSHAAWSAALLAPQPTVAIGFSHSGTTMDTVRYLEIARQSGALTVAITGSPSSPLAEVAEERLISHARESQLRAGAMVSRIAQLSIIDCLFMGVAQQRYDQSIEALKRTRDITHPTSA